MNELDVVKCLNKSKSKITYNKFSNEFNRNDNYNNNACFRAKKNSLNDKDSMLSLSAQQQQHKQTISNNINKYNYLKPSEVNNFNSGVINAKSKPNFNYKCFYSRDLNEIEILAKNNLEAAVAELEKKDTFNEKINKKPPILPRTLQSANINCINNSSNLSLLSSSSSFSSTSSTRSSTSCNQNKCIASIKNRENDQLSKPDTMALSNTFKTLNFESTNLEHLANKPRTPVNLNNYLESKKSICEAGSLNFLTSDPIFPSDTCIGKEIESGKNSNKIEHITTGVVKNLRKKFSPELDSSSPSSPPPSAPPFYSSSVNITLNTNPLEIRRRSRSELITNFQLKKCQSVIFNLENSSNGSSNENEQCMSSFNYSSSSSSNSAQNLTAAIKQNNKRAKSNNCISELNEKTDEKSSIEVKDQIEEELSVFDNVDIKEKINKFSANVAITKPENKAKKSLKILHPSHDPILYGGSCNNLNLTSAKTVQLAVNPAINASSSINKNNNKLEKNFKAFKEKSKIASKLKSKSARTNSVDTDVSNDESSSAFSDDLTSSSNENNYSNFKTKLPRYKSELSIEQHENQINRNASMNFLNEFDTSRTLTNDKENLSPARKNLMRSLNFDSFKFEENYIKIKDAFNDLRKDNELIESLLTDMRNKVKETSTTFLDSYFIQNAFTDQLETSVDFENFSDTIARSVPIISNVTLVNQDPMQLIRHKF